MKEAPVNHHHDHEQREQRYQQSGMGSETVSTPLLRRMRFSSQDAARGVNESAVTTTPRNFHFLGICGTAMGSVAAGLRERGFVVPGSDENIYPPMSTFLASRGVALNEGFRAENIPADADVIVIGNAMKRGNPEVEAVLNRKLYYVSLPQILQENFMRNRHNLVVTGTHGKTT